MNSKNKIASKSLSILVVSAYINSMQGLDSGRIAKIKLGRFVQAIQGDLLDKVYGMPEERRGESAHLHHSVADLADQFPWHEMTREQILCGQRGLREKGYSSFYVKTAQAHAIAMLRECWRQGLITGDELAKRTDQIKAPKVDDAARRGRHIPMDEVEALFEVCEQDEYITGPRDNAMWSLLIAAGLRVAEMVRITIKDIELDSQSLRILGKGGKVVSQPIPDFAWGHLKEWITVLSTVFSDQKQRDVKPPRNFPIFFRVHATLSGPKLDLSKPLTENGVRDILLRRCTQAGTGRISPHDFRRTIIGMLFERGEDIRYIQRFARHSKIETTIAYDRRDNDRFTGFVKSIGL